jgi:hypothetical protein
MGLWYFGVEFCFGLLQDTTLTELLLFCISYRDGYKRMESVYWVQ